LNLTKEEGKTMDLDAYFGHTAESADYRSGLVALIGRPNAGKSTLLNQILGQKIAIVSDKPQTTRTKIQGIYTDETMQVVFFDTPGIHKSKHKLGDYMNKAAEITFGDVDIICYLVDASQPFGGGEAFICSALAEQQKKKTPIFLLLNKIDLLTDEQVEAAAAVYADKLSFAKILPISAKDGERVDELLDALRADLPQGPKYYDDEQLTDQPERQIMSEIIREKIFLATREEIPHSVAVVINQYQRRENGVLYLEANIFVERDSQKGIIIGKGGSMLRQIGSAARSEIENLFDDKVFLELRVKVKKDWRDDPWLLKSFGYDAKKL
jgi:GTP-binding protein Era